MFQKFLPLFLLILSVSSLHAQTVAYVANFDSNSVSVIDTASNAVTATIPVGQRPFGVVFSPDGARAYVTNNGDDTISVIDTASSKVTATITVAASAALQIPAITPDGKSLYVPDENGLFVLSTATNNVVATIPAPSFEVAITPDGTRAYVQTAFSSSTGIPVIDTANNTIVTTVTGVPGFFAFGIADTPNGLTIYTSGGSSQVVSAIATSNNTLTGTIPVTGFPQGIVVTPDGSRVYVILSPESGLGLTVGVIDTATNAQEGTTIAVGNTSSDFLPAFLAVTPDGAFVYVTNSGDGTVSVIDTSTNTMVHTVTVGKSPVGIAIANLSTPFSNLTIKGLTVNQNGFAENGTFSLGANSTGIDLAHQPFTVTVDGFSLTIPGGSFKQVGGNMHFVFNGTINGTPVSVNLIATGGTSTDFKFSLSVTGVDLTGQPNPATVGLKIGSNSGTTTAQF